jgi:outer membrane receptor protein involved in Fe transport
VYLRYGDTEKDLCGGDLQTTNNRMELQAVIEALRALNRPCQIDFFLDSEYVRKGITEWMRGWKARGWRTADKKPVKNTTNIKREEERKSDQDLFATLGFNFRPWENHKVTLGIEGSIRDREKKKIGTEQEIAPTLKPIVEKTGAKDVYSIEENQLNIFVQDEIRLGEKHTLTAGLRMETIDNKATAGDSSEVKQSGTVFNPSLHHKYLVTPTTVLRTSLARTVRRPKFDDFIPFRESKNGS